jgi:hypothetical protein
MRKIFLLLCLAPILLLARNRVATQKDIRLYGHYITPGDLIIDSPTRSFADGINAVSYMNISTSFPDMRENAMIWVDGKKLGAYCEFRLTNGDEQTPWHITSATIKPIPGTRMDGIFSKNGHKGFLHLIQGLKYLRIDGGDDRKYPGLTSFPKKRVFLKGSFGIGATSTGIYKGYHVFSVSVLDGGSIYISGVEGEHGFSVLRLQGGSYDWTVSITIENCYVHDSNSEGMYIGATHAPPLAKIKDLKIKNVICARTGSEALQMQHLIGNCHVSNVTIFDADAGYLKQFQRGQDTGIQLSADQGQNIIENIIVDSWGSHGINLFGSDAFPAGDSSNTTIRNVLLNDGRGPAIYPHNLCKYGMTWLFEDIYIRKPNNDYYIKNRLEPVDYTIAANNGSDSISFSRIFYDMSNPKVFQNKAKLNVGEQTETELPAPEYINSGFYEPASKIKVWHQYFAKYLTWQDSIPTPWEVGDIAEDMEPGQLPLFYKCITAHESTSDRPKSSPNFMILSWDEYGIRSDQPNWNKQSNQKPYPPDDLRIKADSYYGKLNMGCMERP